MAPEQSGDHMARGVLLAALEWQLEAGVDETIADSPLDRAQFAPPAFVANESGARTDPAGKSKRSPAKKPPTKQPAAAKAAPAQAAREAAAGAATLEALRLALEAFDGSALKAGARKTVFADGNSAAALMVVGEAPGRDEDREGLPFVGRSGKLLDQMLGAIGLSRTSEDPARAAYISNVIPWRPLQNRTPDDQEVSLLLPFIQRHIELAKPARVLCLGNIPAKTLMQASSGITRFRGRWRDLEIGGEKIPALATFHPAYLLRKPEAKRMAWRDLLDLLDVLRP